MKVVPQGIRNKNGLYVIDLKTKVNENTPQLQKHHIKNLEAEYNVYAIESKEEIIK